MDFEVQRKNYFFLEGDMFLDIVLFVLVQFEQKDQDFRLELVKI